MLALNRRLTESGVVPISPLTYPLTSPHRVSWLIRSVYSTAWRLFTPLYFARLWWRGIVEPEYRAHWGERLGLRQVAATAHADGGSLLHSMRSDWLWLHAVSLGEARAAASLLEALRAARPGLRILLTHSTATGREAGRSLLHPGDAQAWLPYDTPGAVRRFLQAWQPRVGVLMETEVWPNLLHEAQARGLPMVLANARLSDRSLCKGRRWHLLLAPAVQSLSAVLAQTEDDAQRLRTFGSRSVHVCGNLKFDVMPGPALLAQGRAWREPTADRSARPVVLAASTREGEESPLLQAWLTLPVPRPLLLLVPRHPQRFDEVAALVAQAGLSLWRRSSFGAAVAVQTTLTLPVQAQQADVWLGDSMGEMPMYYAASHIALLGGSFAPLGGQNLIEAAACGCPIILGPHTFNFAQAAEQALAAGAAWRVADFQEGVRLASEIAQGACDLALTASSHPAAVQALLFAQAHRGAAQRQAAAILDLFEPRGRSEV